MTDLSRGVRSRRRGRRPGWLLLTVLLVLAIAASSALVFTERVELLKLAVILSLWAAAVAAFVSVIYRRQSDVDRARARDLKLVYDLQLDREISARREYELEVESQLRRELATELGAQAADEVAALRAELAALRNNLEILFDADLSHRPALEPERTTIRAYSDWQRGTESADDGRPMARFVASTPRQEADDGSENAIIDVPEEPPVPDDEVRAAPQSRYAFESDAQPGTAGEPFSPSEPAAPPYAAPDAMWLPPQPQRAPEPWSVERGGRHGRPAPGEEWQPASVEGQWLPSGAPGSNWMSTNGTSHQPMPAQAVPEEPDRGRHSNPVEPSATPYAQPAARHSDQYTDFVRPPPPPPPPPPVAEPTAQHGEGQGQSVAELLARLQAGAGHAAGGRRRRREG
jgi:hypothetical protein